MGNKGRGEDKKGRRVRVSDCVGEENKSREGNIGREEREVGVSDCGGEEGNKCREERGMENGEREK